MSAPPVETFGTFSTASEALLSRRFAQRLARTIPPINKIEIKMAILSLFISEF
jgi:hypothetical protein